MDVARRELAKLAHETIERELLQARVQRRRVRRLASAQQALRELRREARRGLEPRRSAEPVRGEARELVARRRRRREPAGARGEPGRSVVRTAQRHREQPRLVGIERHRRLAEQRARGGVDARDLAAVAREIEIGLEDLRLRPAMFERARGLHLAPLLRPAPARARAQRRIELGRELHRDRARAARMAAQAVGERGGDGEPVDAAMAQEAPIFVSDDGLAQARRYRGQRRPLAAPPARIGTPLVQQPAVAIEQPRFARRMRGLHVREARQRDRRRTRSARDQRDAEHERRPRAQRAASHGRTLSGAFGSSPYISGAYSASTRVGGSCSSPALLRRTLYSSVKPPFGT